MTRSKRPQSRGHVRNVARRDLARIDARREHERIDVTQAARGLGSGGDELIDSLHLLQIAVHLIGEQGVEHVAEDLARRRHRRLGTVHDDTGLTPRAHADDQQPVRAEMNRGAQRIQLTHRAVAEELIAEASSAETTAGSPSSPSDDPASARSGARCAASATTRDRLDAVVESDRLARSIARRAQRERVQVAARDAAADAGAVDVNTRAIAAAACYRAGTSAATARGRRKPARAPNEIPRAACARDRHGIPAPSGSWPTRAPGLRRRGASGAPRMPALPRQSLRRRSRR